MARDASAPYSRVPPPGPRYPKACRLWATNRQPQFLADGWVRREDQLLPDHDDGPEGASAQDKLNAVLGKGALSKMERSESHLFHALTPEQTRRRRETCAQANGYGIY